MKCLSYSVLVMVMLVIFSCGTEEETVPDLLTISLSSQEVSLGSEVSFSAVSQNNGGVTSTAVFTVNGNEITGNTFSPTEVNDENQVFATWNGLTSSVSTFKSVENVVLPDTYTKKVLVEDYTGTWCGYCPGMNNILNHFTEYSDNVISVAIHCDDDPYQFEFQSELQEAYSVTGLPDGRINRVNPLVLFTENFVTDYCGANVTYYEEMIQTYLDEQAPLGLAIDSQLSGNDLSFQVKVGFLVNEIPNAKLVVYLLEDDLVHEQLNYFAGDGNAECVYSSYGQHIEEFEHNHVLQKAYTDVFGDEIPASNIVTDGVYTRDFNVTIPSNVESTEHLSLVAFVLGGQDNGVINAQYVHVGESQDFD